MGIRPIATVTQGPKVRLGRLGKAIHHENGRVPEPEETSEQPSDRTAAITARSGAASRPQHG